MQLHLNPLNISKTNITKADKIEGIVTFLTKEFRGSPVQNPTLDTTSFPLSSLYKRMKFDRPLPKQCC